MKRINLKIKLKSDACFSRGDGTPGEVDIEVQHDHYGLPFLSGKALKGLLHEEAAELVDALIMAGSTAIKWNEIANRVFGAPGSSLEKQGLVTFGDAMLPADLRSKVIESIQKGEISPHQVLLLFTGSRTQTANDETGAPIPETLRVIRTIPRETPFEAELTVDDKAEEIDLAFLSACVKAFRRAGSNKTRGLGKLLASIDGETKKFDKFEEAI